MEKSNPEHGLIKTMLQLSGADSAGELTGRFISGLNKMYPGAEFTFSSSPADAGSLPVQIFPGGKTCGYLNCSGPDADACGTTFHEEAAALLALLLQNRSQQEAIKEYESGEHFRGIFENATVGIYIATIDEKIISVNPALARMHGFDTPGEMVASIPPGMTLAVNPEEGRRFFSEVHSKGELNNFEIEMYRKDRSTFRVSLSARVVRDADGAPLFFEGTVEDITELKQIMNRLRESEALLNTMTACLPGMIYKFVMKPDGSFSVPYCSDRVRDIFNCEPEDVRGSFEPIMRAILPEDHDMIFRTIRESAAGLTPWIEEFRVQPPGGPVRWIMGNAIPEKSEDGTITWFGFHTDITALKKAEEDLRASDDQMRSIVENTREIIHIIDREGIFHFLSPSWEESTGFSISETIGKSFLPYVHPEDAPACLEVLMNVLNTGKPHRITEFRVKHASGKWIWFSNSGVAIKGAGGETVNFLGVATDITDRKNAENMILAERDFSRAIIDSLPGLFYIINSEGRFINWNRNLNTFTGCSDDELSQMSIIQLTPETNLQQAGSAIQEVLTKGHAEVEAFLIAFDGTVKPFLTNGSLFHEGGKPCIIGLSQDISDRKRLEEQLMQAQKMEAIGQLAGGVAHDFNNLLQAILGYSELILGKMPPSDANHGRMLEVKRAGERATVLTRQLLAFSRRQVLQLVSLDINKVIAELLQMLTRLIGEDIELTFNPSGEPLIARADRGQIEQVITNLCVNARDAMPGGGRLVIGTSSIFADEAYIHGHEWARPGPYACITVTDTGIGMNSEVLNRIFEPFFTTKETHRGTGLGLPMVYGIIRQHQGMVNVYSEPGNGSCFSIYIPAETSGRADVHAHAEQFDFPGGSETILLAEDDTQIRELACHVLQEAGYRVIAAADGEEAVDLYYMHADEIDLLFLDVIMPRLSGRDIYNMVKGTNPGVKCLFASGYSRDGLHNNYILEDGLHLLQKPYTRGSLLGLVRQVLDGGS